jgi:hypothetical protein
MTAPSEVIVDGVRYVPERGLAARVSIHGMYEAHLFHDIEGRTVDEVIKNWLQHNAKKQPAIVGGDYCSDLGPSMLCPAIVLDAKGKELRRVGSMVFPDDNNRRKPASSVALEAYRNALSADPDIPRLLATVAADSRKA